MFKMYHGTTCQGGKDIPINGFRDDNHIWDVSDDDFVYFVAPLRVAESEGVIEEYGALNPDPDAVEEVEQECLRLANEQGQIASATQQFPCPITTVLEFQFDDEYFDLFENDDSCENMYYADQAPLKEINELIRNHKITIIPHYFQFYPKLSLFYLMNIVNNKYFDSHFISDVELNAIKALNKNDVFIDELFETYELAEEELDNFKGLL